MLEPRLHPDAKGALRFVAAAAVTGGIAYYAVDLRDDPGLDPALFAVWLWGATLAWIVVLELIFGTSLTFPDSLHAARPFEASGRLYRRLGVDYARRFMPNGAYATKAMQMVRPGYRVITDYESVVRWEARTRSKEAGHLLHVLVTVPVIAFAAIEQWVAASLVLVALDVVADLYPAMVQRYNRPRMRRVIARESARRGRMEPGPTDIDARLLNRPGS